MTISKLKLSIISTFNQMATDTNGLLLCCTNNEDGDPVVHRVIATDSIVSLLCELKRAGGRKARRVCYDQGVGKLEQYQWNERKKKWTYSGEIEGYDEDKVFVKPLAVAQEDLWKIQYEKDISMTVLRDTIVKHNLFSFEDACDAVEQDRIDLEREQEELSASIKRDEFNTLLESLDEEGLETLKGFVINNESLCKDIVDRLILAIKY
jgi:hypothetical protein